MAFDTIATISSLDEGEEEEKIPVLRTSLIDREPSGSFITTRDSEKSFPMPLVPYRVIVPELDGGDDNISLLKTQIFLDGILREYFHRLLEEERKKRG